MNTNQILSYDLVDMLTGFFFFLKEKCCLNMGEFFKRKFLELFLIEKTFDTGLEIVFENFMI